MHAEHSGGPRQGAAGHEPAGGTGAELSIRGAQLSAEETAAVLTAVTRLAAGAEENDDAGSTGPSDRTIQRRHRLAADAHGLWGRPGPSSWQQAAGGLR